MTLMACHSWLVSFGMCWAHKAKRCFAISVIFVEVALVNSLVASMLIKWLPFLSLHWTDYENYSRKKAGYQIGSYLI